MSRAIPFLLAALLVSGCSTTVKRAQLSADATYYWLGSSPSDAKSVFSTTDEKVTLTVEFQPNFVGGYRTFRVRWIGPGGELFLEEPTSTKWGSNESLIVSLPIAENLPATMPGDWAVELWYQSEQLLRRPFRVVGAE